MFIVIFIVGSYYAVGFGLRHTDVILAHIAPKRIRHSRRLAPYHVSRPLRLQSTYG